MPCASLARLRRGASLRRASRPKPTTARPSPWPRTGDAPPRRRTATGPWHLYATTGQREQARAELDTAMTLYRTMDMTFWLPQAEAALAQIV